MVDRQRLGLPGTESIDVLIERFEAEKLPLVATNTRKSYAQSLKIFRRFLKAKRLDIAVHEFRRGHAPAAIDLRAVPFRFTHRVRHDHQGGHEPAGSRLNKKTTARDWCVRSVHGYKQTPRPRRRYVCSTPNNGHSA